RAAPVAPPQSLSQYQDVEDPEYEDFRAEARLQRGRQLESFNKAAEAYRQGRKDVASYYAQQRRRPQVHRHRKQQVLEKKTTGLLSLSQ
ncbi:unnamed protein product, partial [Coregonus sp. 'balchen']